MLLPEKVKRMLETLKINEICSKVRTYPLIKGVTVRTYGLNTRGSSYVCVM